VLAAAVPRAASAQHITIDGRLSPAQTLVGPNYTIGANLGKQVGSNLFHSFGQFSLSNTPVPESATFTSTGSSAPISNVIGRVTGGNQSSINGAIVSAIPGANLYLINPSGIVFGPHATVNVSGSFHASTADYLKMSDGAKFQATNPDGSTLSAAPPVAFGFMTASPPAITVNGSTLGVPSGQTLGLIGGGTPASPTAITGATLSAPAGTIHVTSAAGTGEVPVDPRNKSALTVTNFGPVAVTGGSTLNVSDPVNLGSGGSVFIRSGALTIDASKINADNYGSGPGGMLVLQGDSQVALSSGTSVHAVAQSTGTGAAVMITTAPSGVVTADTGTVTTGSVGMGNAGPLSVATGQLMLTNGASLTSFTLSATAGAGNAGAITVNAGSLSIETNGEIASGTFGAGNAGSVTVNVAGQLIINGTPESFLTGIASQANAGSGAAGTVMVSAGSLSILNNGVISGSTFGTGNAGTVFVDVVGQVTIDGTLANTNFVTGIVAEAALGSTGNAGTITLNAGNLAMVNGGFIGIFGPGNAGNISVNVADQLSIGGSLSSPFTGIFSDTAIFPGFIGQGGTPGNITIKAGSLSIANNGEISAATFGAANGGSVSVNVAGKLTVDGTGGSSGILASAEPGSTGNAGNLEITAGSLSVISNGEISSSTFGPGRGGSVSVAVAGQLTIDGTLSSVTGITGITSTTSEAFTRGGGSAGSVVVTAEPCRSLATG
jgi:filamentous hemagglutinin family protein